MASVSHKDKELHPPPVSLTVEVTSTASVNGGDGERVVLQTDHDQQQFLEKEESENGHKFLRVSARLGLVNPCGKALYLSTVIFNLRVPFFFLILSFFICHVQILDEEKCRIECLIARYELYLLEPAVVSSEEATGKIHAAVGKAKLLIAQKFKQFAGLCHKNLVSHSVYN